MIKIIGPKSTEKKYIDTTSRSSNWSRGLSPFFCGPVKLYEYYEAKNVENAWQYSKVYEKYANENGPTEDYFIWAIYGWNSQQAHRYPMGKGAKPLYSYWDGEKLDYVEARKKIYIPLYSSAVKKTEAFTKLNEIYQKEGTVTLWDFDGYDHHALNMSYDDVMNCSTKKMGHAFVLAMLLDKYI